MKLVIDQSVWSDFYDSFYYYEKESAQGQQFEHDFFLTLQRIQENPYLYQVVTDRKYRRCLFKRYPHSVFYLIDETTDNLHIVTLAHQRQKPKA